MLYRTGVGHLVITDNACHLGIRDNDHVCLGVVDFNILS